jgi:hypothetical protein
VHRLLTFLLPYISWYLRNALGPESDAASILRTPARIEITRTHLDVIFPLDCASVPARIAGLDANPGWMPSLNRVITFYFQ